MEWEKAKYLWAGNLLQKNNKRYDTITDITEIVCGGGEVQIGDYTWDTEESSIDILIQYKLNGQFRSELYTYYDFGSLITEIVEFVTLYDSNVPKV